MRGSVGLPPCGVIDSGRAMISWRKLEETMRAALRKIAITAAAAVTIVGASGASHYGGCTMGWLAWRRLAWRRLARRRLGLGLCAGICTRPRPRCCSVLRLRRPLLRSLRVWRLRDAPTRCNQPLGSPCVVMGGGLLLNASSPQKENGRALPGRCLGRIGDQNASYC